MKGQIVFCKKMEVEEIAITFAFLSFFKYNCSKQKEL